MSCPYAEPTCTSDIATDLSRCLCGRYAKPCAQCPTRNRAFARYCRGCGAALQPSSGNWTGYKGGPRRLGSSDALPPSECITRPTGLRLRLGDPCRGLLGYDGHLVAVSSNGVVEIADPMSAKRVCRFQAQGPMTAEPCIVDGALYLATRGQITAYALAAMTMETPHVRPLWHVGVDGTPIQALTPVGDRVYVTVASTDRREVHVIDRHSARPLHDAPKISWIASDGSSAIFLSEDAGGVRLHVANGSMSTHPVALHGLAEHPIAVIGGSIFGIFGESHRLYRIDVATGEVEEPLDDDTQLFALSHDGQEWDRDGVSVDSRGIVFSRSGVRDSLAPHERPTRGSPVIVQGCAVAVGMEDGRVLVYTLAQLPHHEIWRLGDGSGAAITSLASFDSYLAAGNRDGVVEARELLAKGLAS